MEDNPWQEMTDPGTGRLYLWNARTREIRWPLIPQAGFPVSPASQNASGAGTPYHNEDPRTPQQTPRRIDYQSSVVSPSSPNYGWNISASGNASANLAAGLGQLHLSPGPLSQPYHDQGTGNFPYINRSTGQHSNVSPASASYIQDTSGPYIAHPATYQSSSGFQPPYTHYSSDDSGAAFVSPRHGRHIRGSQTGSLTDPLDPEYKVRSNPAKWFKPGKIFMTLWSEPTASGNIGSEITLGIYQQHVHSRIRRFVVIRTGNGSSACLPILTYTGSGVSKKGVQKSDHAIIYTGTTVPRPLPEESPSYVGERGMLPVPIKVEPHVRGEKLDPLSRVNLGKIYTVEHNLKVRGFGMVENVEQLKRLHRAVWDKEHTPSITQPQQGNYPKGGANQTWNHLPTPGSMPSASGKRAQLPASSLYGSIYQSGLMERSNMSTLQHASQQPSSSGTTGMPDSAQYRVLRTDHRKDTEDEAEDASEGE